MLMVTARPVASAHRRARVLLLPHPVGERLFEPWGRDVVDAIGDRHDLALFDAAAPLSAQFRGVDVVVDIGGAAGTRAMADAAAGGVRLWQILGTGFDHFDLAYWRSKGIPVANCPGLLSAPVLGWPLDQTLLISAGIQPGILQDKNGFLNLRIPGTVPTSTELLVFHRESAISL